MLTIYDLAPCDFVTDIPKFSYQQSLTAKLDNVPVNFNQETINEIVLWKMNCYAELDQNVLDLINKISVEDTTVDPTLTVDILRKLLGKDQKGIRLAMATTILRFKNPRIYQILDQRIYRFIYGQKLTFSHSNIDRQIELYLNYLDKMREICTQYNVEFASADRILYQMDRIYNVDLNVKGYRL